MLNDFLSGSAAWGVLLTLAAFALGALINRITGKAIFNPLLLGSIFVIIFLSVCKIPYADYKASAAPVNYLLLPATVALAIPLYEKWDLLRENAAAIGLDLTHSAVIPDGRTGTYLFIDDSDGDMALAVNDMSIYDHMTPDFLRQRLDFINHADLVVVETNLPEASLHWLCQHCTAPLLADPVSTIKAPKLQPVLGHLTALKPNRMEAELLSGVPIHNEADAARAAEKLLDTGLQQVYISLGSDGLYAADRQGHTVRVACPKVQIANATGGGDAVAAALASCMAHGKTLEEAAHLAIGAGALACTSPETIHPGMSWENIQYILDKEEL